MPEKLKMDVESVTDGFIRADALRYERNHLHASRRQCPSVSSRARTRRQATSSRKSGSAQLPVNNVIWQGDMRQRDGGAEGGDEGETGKRFRKVPETVTVTTPSDPPASVLCLRRRAFA
jgi:hypothetical protein